MFDNIYILYSIYRARKKSITDSGPVSGIMRISLPIGKCHSYNNNNILLTLIFNNYEEETHDGSSASGRFVAGSLR